MVIQNSKITVSVYEVGDGWSTGIFNYGTSPGTFVNMNGVDVSASGPSISGSHTYAVRVSSAEIRMTNCHLQSSFASIFDWEGTANLTEVHVSILKGRIYKYAGDNEYCREPARRCH